VAGPEASGFKFTSALPVQILKILAPKLMPLIEGSDPGIQIVRTEADASKD
jgi:hypothetical protein